MRNRQTQRGFTLIEMMIALLLGAVIITPLYIVTRGMSMETTRRQMETEAMQRARLGMEMLAADFQRAGMMVSPDPERDPDSIVQEDQHARYRRALVHLNRDGTATDEGAFDAVLLTGNLVTANTYTAMIGAGSGSEVLVLNEPFGHIDDCLREFSAKYAYAHLTTATGQTLDAKIAAGDSSVTCPDHPYVPDSCQCTVSLANGELILDGPGGFSEGQQVYVRANQTALYRVETVSEERALSASENCEVRHNKLVRYFVDYDGAAAGALGGQACSLANITDEIIDFASAKIIAEYVTDFQVWFRTVRPGSTVDLRPNYHQISELGATMGFVPESTSPIVGENAGESTTGATHLSCGLDSTDMGPEHVRSAMIRLAVRTEVTDSQTRMAGFDDAGVARFNVASPPADDALCPEVGMYKVRTLTTEVAMPNLAARIASFSEHPGF
ncbi:MAG TPA: prepilin-type N-terminal cleavage/methylation domain-containing protein [Polyangia bacterium]|nr:prepilin-type N-terminal cleavage/methylation domain-containing protein [Polyangia bacterium]